MKPEISRCRVCLEPVSYFPQSDSDIIPYEHVAEHFAREVSHVNNSVELSTLVDLTMFAFTSADVSFDWCMGVFPGCRFYLAEYGVYKSGI